MWTTSEEGEEGLEGLLVLVPLLALSLSLLPYSLSPVHLSLSLSLSSLSLSRLSLSPLSCLSRLSRPPVSFLIPSRSESRRFSSLIPWRLSRWRQLSSASASCRGRLLPTSSPRPAVGWWGDVAGAWRRATVSVTSAPRPGGVTATDTAAVAAASHARAKGRRCGVESWRRTREGAGGAGAATFACRCCPPAQARTLPERRTRAPHCLGQTRCRARPRPRPAQQRSTATPTTHRLRARTPANQACTVRLPPAPKPTRAPVRACRARHGGPDPGPLR